MRTGRRLEKEPIFQPPASVAGRRDRIDKALEIERESRPWWARVLLLVSTAALLPGAFGQHDILNPGAMKNPFGEPDGFDNEPTHEQQALKFVGQSQQQSGGPPRQQQQAPPRGAQ